MSSVTVFVDHAFAAGDWGRWSGGGHMQADTLDELHAFADRIGLRREWFQSKPGRPENDHYDLTGAGRELAIELGAIIEDRRAGTRRRQAIRLARVNRVAGEGDGVGDDPDDRGVDDGVDPAGHDGADGLPERAAHCG
jgi:hypothetical protein